MNLMIFLWAMMAIGYGVEIAMGMRYKQLNEELDKAIATYRNLSQSCFKEARDLELEKQKYEDMIQELHKSCPESAVDKIELDESGEDHE